MGVSLWRRITIQYLLICVCFYMQSSHVSGLPYSMIPPEMADALMLLVPSEQERFVEDCLSYTTCSRKEVQNYVWQSENIRDIGQVRFWHTYKCTKSSNKRECPVDGDWSAWSVWSDCGVTCGKGSQVRSRTCSHPLPHNGGRECDGQPQQVTGCSMTRACSRSENSLQESVLSRAWEFLLPYHTKDPDLERSCLMSHCSYQQVQDMVTPSNLADQYWTHLNCYKHLEGCPVDGGWSSWGTWSGCSSNCGEGKNYRARQCDNPLPQNWGRPCDGPSLEEGSCFDDTCVNTVGVFLTPWSPWSECTPNNRNLMCGEGVRVSTRRCHGEAKCDVGGEAPVEALYREVPCFAGLCPQSGRFSEWNEWSVCTGLCSEGYRLRQRVCDHPRPQGIGLQCKGENYEVSDCLHNALFCNGTDVEQVLEYTNWNHWTECSQSCDGGVRIRHRSCITRVHLCTGQLYDYSLCNDGIPCPVNGGWSDWTSWSVCSVTCGRGISSRYRQCSSPHPEFGGQMCEGETHQEEPCNNLRCAIDSPEWEAWQPWSQCSSTCGGGTKTRERDCNSGRGGMQCAGESRQLSVCNYHHCPGNGNWASWGEWSECSVSCNEGTTERDRTCTDPSPTGDGKICDGFGTEVRHCYKHPCSARGSMVRTFDGTSFMVYRRSAVPTKHLFLYIRFLSNTLNGLLVLRRQDEHNVPLVSVGLANGYVRLYAKTETGEVDIIGDQIKSPGWNTAEVAISGSMARVRVNSGIPAVGNFSAPPPQNMDWDLKMYIGGTMPHLFPGKDEQNVGFSGKIASLRFNYQEYSLYQMEEWRGGGLPYVSLNVGEQPGDVDAEIPDFNGSEYTVIPFNMNASHALDLSVTFKTETETGTLLYIPGEVAGSFVAVGLSRCRLVMYMNMGADTVNAKSDIVPLSEWILVHIALRNFAGEMRVNRGPAVQLMALGPPSLTAPRIYNSAYFHPSGAIYVGGVSLSNEINLRLSIGDSSPFVGKIYKVDVNADTYSLRDAALTSYEKYIDAASATVAAHYRQVHAIVNSNMWIRCNYSLAPKDENLKVKWLKWDELLVLNDIIERVDDDLRYPQVSSLHLRGITADTQGMYACQLRLDGVALITHAFGISIYQPQYAILDNDSIIELLILMSVALAFGFVLFIVLCSLCKPIRKRSYFFDRVYESIVHCLGCQKCAAGTKGYYATCDELRAVEETYVGYSAKKEKAKLDKLIAQKKVTKLKGKVQAVRQKVQGKFRKNKSTKVDAEERGKLAKTSPSTKKRESAPSSVKQSQRSDGKSQSPRNIKDSREKQTRRSTPSPDKQMSKKVSPSPTKTKNSMRKESPRGTTKETSRKSKSPASPRSKNTSNGNSTEKRDKTPRRYDDQPIYDNIEGLKVQDSPIHINDATLVQSSTHTTEPAAEPLVEHKDHVSHKNRPQSVTAEEQIYMNIGASSAAEEQIYMNSGASPAAEEQIYMNIGASPSSRRMSRYESIQIGMEDTGGHLFNQRATGAAAALSAAIADLDDGDVSGSVEDIMSNTEIEPLAYNMSDIDAALGNDDEIEQTEAVMTSITHIDSETGSDHDVGSVHSSVAATEGENLHENEETPTQSESSRDIIAEDDHQMESDDDDWDTESSLL